MWQAHYAELCLGFGEQVNKQDLQEVNIISEQWHPQQNCPHVQLIYFLVSRCSHPPHTSHRALSSRHGSWVPVPLTASYYVACFPRAGHFFPNTFMAVTWIAITWRQVNTVRTQTTTCRHTQTHKEQTRLHTHIPCMYVHLGIWVCVSLRPCHHRPSQQHEIPVCSGRCYYVRRGTTSPSYIHCKLFGRH